MAIEKRQMTKRERDAQETKNKVFITAITLFEKYGFDTVTIDDITKEAGVSKGTFYTHFTSKESVLLEQFNKIDECYERAFREIPPDTSAGERLKLLIETMCYYCSNVCGVNVLKIVYMNQISLNDRQKRINEEYNRIAYEFLEEIVSLGIDSGEFKVDIEKNLLIEYIARFMRSLIYDWCMHDGKTDLEVMGDEFFEIIIKWLRKE